MIRALLLADTHLGPGHALHLVDKITAELEAADVIFHAGDVTDESVLAALADFADVHAVRGNNDVDPSLPERLSIVVDGCSIAMIHDSGPSAGRRRRLRQWFPSADVVVFGHSHVPCTSETSAPSTARCSITSILVRPFNDVANPAARWVGSNSTTAAFERSATPSCDAGNFGRDSEWMSTPRSTVTRADNVVVVGHDDLPDKGSVLRVRA